MFNDIVPLHSKTRINQAGQRVRDGVATGDDETVIENWRASHSHILNTFQATLRRRSRGKKITVAQRLKRRNTINDKLVREPGMQLSRMNDIAGCRLIFQNEQELFEFRNSLHRARFQHVLKNDDARYNYIERPKNSGYRGVHDVYQYKGITDHGAKWDGLLLEIQYRTTFQHAWATAVEVADFIDTTRIKFGEAGQTHKQFFRLASELISRQFENRSSCCPELGNKELVVAFKSMDNRIKLLSTFRGLIKKEDDVRSTGIAILIFHSDRKLDVKNFSSMSSAIKEYAELERKYENTSADIVLVRANNSDSIRDAFRNYFSDVMDFVRFIDESCNTLST